MGVGEHWPDLQGWLPTLGLRSDRCSHSSLRGWSTRPTFVPSETVRGLHARGRAHSARASESTGPICKAGCRPWVSGYTDASTHIGMASTRPTFVHSETVRGLHARGRAPSARASDSNGVVLPAGCRPFGYPVRPILAHILAWRRRDRFRPSRFLTGLTHSPCHQRRYPSAL